MKKIKWFFGVVILMTLVLLLIGTQAEAKRLWQVDGLIGDATSGTSRYLDQIDSTSGVSNLATGDFALYVNSGTGASTFSVFIYDSGATGTNGVSQNPFTVVPYDDPATGLWTEVTVTSVSGYVTSGSTLYVGTGGAGIFASGASAYITDQNGNSKDFGDLISAAP